MTEVMTPLTDYVVDAEMWDAPHSSISPYARMTDHARTLERRLQLAEARNAELERAVEDAPHDEWCGLTGKYPWPWTNPRECNCWKSAVRREG